MKSTKDLTVGSPMKLILGFALPLLGGMLFQQVYSLMDTMIVGQFLGVDALAGVGSTGSINFMVIGFCMGVCAGFSIPIAQKFGAKDYAAMRRFVANSVYMAAVFAVVMTLCICVLTRPILQWMNTPEDIIDYAYDYIFVIFMGIPIVYLYNLFSSIIRALGDSKAPVLFLVIASVINIALDIVLIVNFHMGVAGAAVATNISQLVSGLLCLLYIWKKIDVLRMQREDLKPDLHQCRMLFVMGIPMGLQYSITAIGSVVLQTAVNSLGSTYVAIMTAAGKVSMFFCCPFDALGTTMATYGGQNVGAGKLERLTPGLKSATAVGVCYAVAAFLVLTFFGSRISLVFFGEGEATEMILDNVRLFLMCNSAFYIPLLFVNEIRFLIQGMGYPGFAILSGVMEMIARIVAALVLIPLLGFTGACLASPLAWLFADAFLFPAYFRLYKQTCRRFGMLAQQT
ncbi:MAG: MATE family efflux transporter [Eubacteriales bacterium]|nr:MATE family efflux transporter [Eubacteriales bacterium]